MKTIGTIVAALAVLMMPLVFTSCGTGSDLKRPASRDKAIIRLADGSVINVEIRKWRTFHGANQILIVTTDGTVYAVHPVNLTLIHKQGE